MVARTELLEHDRLPTAPGGLVEARGPLQPNAVYDTDELKMIFYDEPNLGSYQRDFDRIFAEPRYLDAAANQARFAALARRARADRRPLTWWTARAPYRNDPDGFALVYDRFYRWVDRLAS